MGLGQNSKTSSFFFTDINQATSSFALFCSSSCLVSYSNLPLADAAQKLHTDWTSGHYPPFAWSTPEFQLCVGQPDVQQKRELIKH